jgi:hypothetical protein
MLESKIPGMFVEEESAEHIAVASPILMRVVFFTGFIGLAMVIAGVALVWLGASGNSEIEILSATIKTANVGLGSIFCGLVLCLFTFRRMLKTLVDLAALR